MYLDITLIHLEKITLIQFETRSKWYFNKRSIANLREIIPKLSRKWIT